MNVIAKDLYLKLIFTENVLLKCIDGGQKEEEEDSNNKAQP